WGVPHVWRPVREPGACDGTAPVRRPALDRAHRTAALRLAPELGARGARTGEPAVRRRRWRSRALAAWVAPEHLGVDRLHRAVRRGGPEWARAPHHRATVASRRQCERRG